MNWQVATTLIGALAALTGAPLTAMVFYLRAIRDDQRDVRSALAQKLERIRADQRRLEQSLDQVERSFTTKDEWVRETMLARQQLARLTEMMTRIQAELETSRGLATQFVRATNAILEMTERLSRRLTHHESGQHAD